MQKKRYDYILILKWIKTKTPEVAFLAKMIDFALSPNEYHFVKAVRFDSKQYQKEKHT